MRIALKIAYDGTRFYGFQRQPDLRTVEGDIIKVLKKLRIIEDVREANFKGASRTDRGVSAFGNVIAFDTVKPELTEPRILNHHLRDIWILGKAEVPEDFHPRFWAKNKIYRYYLFDDGIDVTKLKACAKVFLGEHDFSNFAHLEEFKNPVREVNRIDVFSRGRIIVVEIEGKSFLWEMARRIVTALKLCSLGVLSIKDVELMLKEKVGKKLPPAPPENLVLWEVVYEGIKFKKDAYAIEKVKREFLEGFRKYLTKSAILEDWLISL